MTDVFVSYKSEERALAGTVVAKLYEAGLMTWWDQVLSGERFEDEIRRIMSSASSVVLLLSQHSVKSDYVMKEAVWAGSKLVPARIDDVALSDMPSHIREYDILDLRGWTGAAHHGEWNKLVGRCHRLKGASIAAPGGALSAQSAQQAPGQGAKWSIGAIHAQGPVILEQNNADKSLKE
jgi:TIR domain